MSDRHKGNKPGCLSFIRACPHSQMLLLSTPEVHARNFQVTIFLTVPQPEFTYPVLQSLPQKSVSNPFSLRIPAVTNLGQPIIPFLSYHSGLQTGLSPSLLLPSHPFPWSSLPSSCHPGLLGHLVTADLSDLISIQPPSHCATATLAFSFLPFQLLTASYAFAFPAPSAWNVLNLSSPGLLLLISSVKLSVHVLRPLTSLP